MKLLLLNRFIAAAGCAACLMGTISTAQDAQPHAPQRIVTIGPSAAETVCAIGACDRIVGVSKFCAFPPELADRPRVGGLIDPDLEAIITLQPDLVIIRGRSDVLERQCSAMNIPVHLDKTERLLDIPREVLAIGRLLGLEDSAKKRANEFQQKLDNIKTRLSDRERPRVFITVGRVPSELGNILTSGKGTFLSDALELIQTNNAFGQIDMGWPTVTLESILVARPDVILEFMPGKEMDGETREVAIAAWNSAGPIPAVRHKRIYFVTAENALIPSLRYADVVERISRMIHPER